MRKLFFVTILSCLSVNAFAGTVSVSPFISGNDVTIAALETQRTTFSNVINGNIEGGINIKAGSLVSQDFSNNVSPVTRWNESFTDFTYTGMLAPTSASLTSTISAGTSYVDGYRVVIGSTAHTFTASRDTYVYVHSGGYYVYSEVANGGSQPSTPSNTLLLFKAVTDGTTVSSVSDLRTTGIGFGTVTSIVPTDYRREMYVYQASTTTITVAPGTLEISGNRISKTSATTLTISTAEHWAGGVSFRAVSTKAYVGVDTSGNIKMHTTAPTHSDYNLSVTNGTKRYVAWSGTTYRVIGWFYMNATGAGELNSYEVSNNADGSVKNIVRQATGASSTGTNNVPVDNTTPQIGELNVWFTQNFVPTNVKNKIRVRSLLHFSTSAGVKRIAALFKDASADAVSTATSVASATTVLAEVYVEYEVIAGSLSLTTFKVASGGDTGSGTTTLNGESGAQIFNGTLLSYIEIEEIESQLT